MSALAMTSSDGPDGPIMVTISGEFDRTNQEMLLACVRRAADHGPVVLDLADTAFVGSVMLGILAEARDRGVRLSIRNARPHVETILTMSGFSTLLD